MEPLQAPLEGKENRMKKLWAVAAAALAACMLFVFVGCDEGESGNNGGESGNNGGPSSSAKTDVTAEEWAAAIGANGLTDVFTVTVKSEDDTNELKVNIPENVLYEQSGDRAAICTKEENVYYRYDSSDGEQSWTRSVITESEYNGYISVYKVGVTVVLNAVSSQYEAFTYADGVYTAEEVTVPNVGTAQTMTLAFADGSLQSITYTVMNDSVPVDYSTMFGTAEIAVPTEYTEAALDEAAWNAMISAALQKFDFAMTDAPVTNAEQVEKQQYKYDQSSGDAYYLYEPSSTSTSDRHIYFTAEGETYYLYRLDEDAGTWSRTEISDSKYTREITTIRQSSAPYLNWIASHYEEFTEENGTYTAASITDDDMFSSAVTDVVIVVEGGALKSVQYSGVYSGIRNTFTFAFGSAVSIAIPADYTEA